MIIYNEKQIKYLRTMGQLIIYSTEDLKTTEEVISNIDDLPLFFVSIDIEVEDCTMEDLEECVDCSGFTSLKEWLSSMKYNENIKGFLYYIALKKKID